MSSGIVLIAGLVRPVFLIRGDQKEIKRRSGPMWRVNPQTTTANDGTIFPISSDVSSRYLGFTATNESYPITCCHVLPYFMYFNWLLPRMGTFAQLQLGPLLRT